MLWLLLLNPIIGGTLRNASDFGTAFGAMTDAHHFADWFEGTAVYRLLVKGITVTVIAGCHAFAAFSC
jgi:hypothetical protein